MARPLRIEYPGALYHVTSRGNGRQKVYRDDEDRETFLTTLAGVVQRFGWICHAYCLMGNHYHLLIGTPQPNLSKGMRQLNGVYTQTFNRRHRRVGHLFQGRFKAILVERNSYLLELARFVVLNPVRAKMVKVPERYPWSSYLPTLGRAPVPAGLTIDWILNAFAKTKPTARGRYREFVHGGIGGASPWAQLRGQVLLGHKAFIEKMRPHLQQQASLRKIPKKQRWVHRKSLINVLSGAAAASKATRNQAMARAYLKYGYTQAEIGRELGLHYATVSRIIKAVEDGKS
jgi:putative transposase